jgi:FlaA1/EpsC-like NDP-sugar epimerase
MFGFYRVIPFVIAIRGISFFIGKPYSSIVRYTGSKDAQRIAVVLFAGMIFFGLFNVVYFKILHSFLIPYSIIIIDFLVSVFVMIGSRIAVKILYIEWKNPSKSKTNVIIYGAGESGIITKRTLDRDAGTKYNVLAFIDDNAKKAGKKLEGVSIYQTNQLESLLKDNSVAHLIISVQDLAPARKQEAVEICLNYNVKVLNVPPVATWINGELSFKQIKKVKIQDLLERDPIKLDLDIIKKNISGKTVLITGAAGSIGSELVRQVLNFKPKFVVLLDQAESDLYDIDMEIHESQRKDHVESVIGDIRNRERMTNVFRTFNPEIVFHAAAYKHVPMMESNPSESIQTNVLGTKILADLAVEYNTEKFVMISTDKAVNPTNIMGASKRIAEKYIQSLNKITKTKFITTRFGNVLASNGSVIPRFQKQIEEGGPITVTHPEISRYFMTIPEACQLVLEAGALGKGGEIFIFDMGKSVKIVDLAKKMVKLSGLSLGKDIQLVYTGLRPGEKLYEELLNDKENVLPTHHPKIMIANVEENDFESISKEICELISLFQTQDNLAIVKKMKQIVPEFISNNSIYEQLDAIESEVL